jgi:hypothetical protein
VPWLFALTLFAGAVLLFAVQPMVVRMLLPSLGGSPAVWNTCLVFFQGVLLLGYLYSHLTTRWLGLRRQAIGHLVLLAIVIPALPIAVRNSGPSAEGSAFWLLGTLLIAVGLPFFAVSTTSPLLQRWYGATQARGASDPYFLSVASNFGCMIALLAYPLLIEPALRLSEQSDWWRWGYVGYMALVVACACVVVSRDATAERETRTLPPTALRSEDSASRLHGLRWTILAFVPSSLLVGVTNAITTDIAPIPLLWVIPLSLYLLTFIIAFAPGAKLPLGVLGKILAVSAVALALTLLIGATEPITLVLAIHLSILFLAGLVCHGRLARERPSVDQLTSFYLWMSLGGVLGGAFNALLAPILFHRLGFVEYPLAILVACALRPVPVEQLRFRFSDIAFPVLLGLIAAGVVLLARLEFATIRARELAESTGLKAEMIKTAACFGLPLIVAYTLVDRPIRFSLALGALFLAGTLDEGTQGRVIHLERNFLGVVKVTRSPDGEFTQMVHGNTVHGQQRITPRPAYVAAFLHPVGSTSVLNELSILAAADGRWDDRRRPLTYYHPTGPAGITFRYLVDGWTGPRRIGAVGLGTGAIASYARPNQDWTFFELDPAVERLARNERYFTFLRDSRARTMNVVIGDARLKLASEPDGSFDLLVLDAFSSDAIPIHLLTAEAFALYERKLAPSGVILLHLSNRYLDLAPVVAKNCETADPTLVIRQNDDLGTTDREKEDGKYPSIWVIVARREEDLGPLKRSPRGFVPARPSTSSRWTDDRTDVLGALRRSEE